MAWDKEKIRNPILRKLFDSIFNGTTRIPAIDTTALSVNSTLTVASGASVTGLPAGPAGADAVWVEVDTPCVLIPCDAAGASTAGSTTITMRAYIGQAQAELQSLGVAEDPPTTGITATATASSGSGGSAHWLELEVSWPTGTLSAEKGVVGVGLAVTGFYVAGDQNTMIFKKIPWCKVKAGGAS